MANYDLAEIAKAQTIATGKYQSNEFNFRSPEVWKLLLRNGVTMSPDYQVVKTSIDRVIEMNFKNRTSRALGGAPSHTHTGTQGDSSIVTPTWTPHSDKFASTLKEANNKIYTAEEMLVDKMTNTFINFAEGIETVAAAFTFSNRTQVGASVAGAVWDGTDFVYKITQSTNGERAISIMKMVMDLNKEQNTVFDVIFDPIAWIEFESQINQGQSNDTNTAYQFNGVNFILDADLTAAGTGLVGGYNKGFWLAVPQGTAGAMPWIDVQSRNGDESTVATYSNVINPIDGVQLAIHTYETRVDGTSLGGQIQDVSTEAQLAVYVAFEVAPSSTSNSSPIKAFALV